MSKKIYDIKVGEQGFMMGEPKIVSMKYVDIFKSFLFWLAVVCIFGFQAFRFHAIYLHIGFLEYLGIFIGSFIIVTIIRSLTFFIGKIKKRK